MSTLIPLSDWLRQAPDRPLAVGPEGVLGYAELAARVAYWCRTLPARSGERWALYHQDSFEFVALLFALWQKGCTACIPGDNLPATVQRLQPNVAGFAGDFSAAPPLPDAVPVGEGFAGPWRALPGDVTAIEVYTSGSTGAPKPIGKTFFQLEQELEALERRWPGERDAVLLATVTHQHFYGMVFRLFWPLCKGQPFARHSCRFTEDVYHLARLYPRFCLVSTPSHLGRLGPSLDWTALQSRCAVLYSSAAPLRREDSLKVKALLGAPVREIYGSSETGAIAWRIQDSSRPAEWAPMPGVVVDAGAEGNLRVRAPQVGVESQLLADRVAFSEEGRFRLLGRADRIAKVEGKRVSLAEVEQLAEQQPWIRQARALVVTRRRTEVALVVELTGEGRQRLLAQGKKALVRHLRESFRSHLEPVAWPRRWRFVEQMPCNQQGKIVMSSLKALFEPKGETWPQVLQQTRSGSRLELELQIPRSLIYFDGHFPGNPVLPGVTQLHWAVRYAQQHFSLDRTFYQLEAVKFQQVIFPDDQVRLVLEYSSAKNKLVFSYESDKGRHSSGRICFD